MSAEPTRPCGDPGRTMFHEHVGRFFAAEPRLKELPPGTRCPRCGTTEARLWATGSGDAACLAQQTITRKRRNRASADEPALPVADKAGMGCFGKGNVAVAGPHVAQVTTKLFPEHVPPPGMAIAFGGTGGVNRALVTLFENVPEPPFVAIVFDDNASFAIAPTTDKSRVVVNGVRRMVVDTHRLATLLALRQRIGGTALDRLAELRERMAGGGAHDPRTRRADEEAHLAMRQAGTLDAAAFRALPSPSSDEMLLLRKIAAAGQ